MKHIIYSAKLAFNQHKTLLITNNVALEIRNQFLNRIFETFHAIDAKI